MKFASTSTVYTLTLRKGWLIKAGIYAAVFYAGVLVQWAVTQ